jgi:hypothetical protein
MPIKHLEHSEIDYEKWNKSILHAKNQLVYAETWYLDIVSRIGKLLLQMTMSM